MHNQSTVLIVDDVASGREILADLLSQDEYQILFAENGHQALEQAARHHPDLILLDVMMPDLDGFEVCRRLRANPALSQVPVIIVTTLDDRASRLRGLEVGADDFLSKPFDRLELRTRVRTITRLNRYRRLNIERARFEWVVERAADGFLIVDDDDQIRYANLAARAYLHLDPDPQTPVTGIFRALVTSFYRCEPEQVWTQWPAVADTPLYLVLSEASGQATLWLHLEQHALPAGPDQGRLIRLSDVTAQVGAQRDTWRLHNMILHKLRTPLVGMLGGLEFLARDGEDLDIEEMIQLAQIAYTNVRSLHNAVEEVVRYTTAPVLADSLGGGFAIEQLELLLHTFSSEMGLEQPPVTIHAGLEQDRLAIAEAAFELIARELLENAQKFHPNGSPRVEVAVQPSDEGYVRLRFIDDGVTLSPAQLSRLGTPHYQAEKIFTGQVPGMGLGLATITAMLWEVGGNLRIGNRPDAPGVMVDVILPLV